MIRNITKYTGIGEASASIALAALSANPATAAWNNSFTFFVFKVFFTVLASIGLVILNVGGEKIQTILDQGDFDGSLEKAEKLIRDIRNTGRELTPAEIEAIDGPAIIALRKFASFGKRNKKKVVK